MRKTDANTEWVARRLAKLVGVPAAAIGYAGLKDRHAVTTQWLSIPRPPAGLPDCSGLREDGIEVLEAIPHRRKLRRGALRGNRFEIIARDLDPPAPDLGARIATIRAHGVPNYFGAQRFGRDQSNLRRADALFAGTAARVSRHLSGLWLSAARSQLFNEILAVRVRRADWDHARDGDCLQLDGSHAYFLAETIDEDLTARCAALDIHPTGPLWGKGEPPTHGPVRRLESELAERHPVWCAGLAAFGLCQERRALRVPVPDLIVASLPDGLSLRFTLPAGAYATGVLRELIATSEPEPICD